MTFTRKQETQLRREFAKVMNVNIDDVILADANNVPGDWWFVEFWQVRAISDRIPGKTFEIEVAVSKDRRTALSVLYRTTA